MTCSSVASWLVCLTPDWAVQAVWVLAGDIVLCSWARHLTLTALLSTQSLNCTETGISSGLMGHLGFYADFTLPYLMPSTLSAKTQNEKKNITKRKMPFFCILKSRPNMHRLFLISCTLEPVYSWVNQQCKNHPSNDCAGYNWLQKSIWGLSHSPWTLFGFTCVKKWWTSKQWAFSHFPALQYRSKGLQHYTREKWVYYMHITCSIHVVSTHLTHKYMKMCVITLFTVFFRCSFSKK